MDPFVQPDDVSMITAGGTYSLRPSFASGSTAALPRSIEHRIRTSCKFENTVGTAYDDWHFMSSFLHQTLVSGHGSFPTMGRSD